MKHEPIPTNEVLAWLAEHHPELVQHAEVDRAWTWLAVDLREKPEVRQSLKEYGFVFARRGHALPSGALGTWGHSCDAPLPFTRRDKQPRSPSRKQESGRPSTIRTNKSHTASGRYDPLAQSAPLPVPATQAAGAVDHSTIDPEVLAWIN